jgi:hypothetical protein
MADEKKPSFFKSQLEGWKAKALYDFAKYAVGAAILSYFGPAAFNQNFKHALYLFACLIGIYFMAAAFRLRGKGATYDPRLAAALLRVDAEAILQKYRQLDFDHRQESRLPLNSASWPNYDKTWDFVDVTLCIQSRMMNILVMKAHILWTQMGYEDEPQLFSLNENSLLYQVIDALEDFKDRTRLLHGRG